FVTVIGDRIATQRLRAHICWRQSVACPTRKLLTLELQASNWTVKATFKSMNNWKRTFLASTHWAMSKVGQLSLTFLTQTSAFCAPTCLSMGAPAFEIVLSPIRFSSIRSLGGLA